MQTDRYQTHAIWNSLSTAQEAFEAIPKPDHGDYGLKYDTVGAFLTYIDAYREDDGLLILDDRLQQAYQYVEQVRQNLQGLKGTDPNWNWGHLDNAYSQVQQAVQYMNQNFPQPSGDSATAASKRAVAMWRKSLDTSAAEARGEIEALRERVAELEAERAAQEQALNTALADVRTRLDSSEQQIATQTTRLQEQIDEQRASFETDATNRAEEFRAEIQRREEAAGERWTALEVAQKTKFAAYADEAETALEAIRDNEARSEALIDTTARNAIAGNYGQWASAQGRAAFAWTFLAVAIGLATAGSLVYALKGASDDSLQFTIYKTSVAVVGLIIAGYCARLAAEHRHEERKAKRLHLDLAAMEPFLKQVENPNELREEIAKRVFVPEPTSTEEAVPRFGFRRGLTVEEIVSLINIGRGTGPGVGPGA